MMSQSSPRTEEKRMGAAAEGPHMAIAAGAKLPQRPVLMMAELDLVRIDLPQARPQTTSLSNVRKDIAAQKPLFFMTRKNQGQGELPCLLPR